MPIYASDLLPDVSGRNIGSADKRWDLWVRNINFSGGLSGQGLQTWAIANANPNSDAFLVSADRGDGTMRDLLRVRNVSNQPAEIDIQQSLVRFGNVSAALGGLVPLSFFSPAANLNPQLTFYRAGSATLPALLIDSKGDIISYGKNQSIAPLQIFADGDTQATWLVNPLGVLQWGAGGNIARDVTLGRSAVGVLQIGNNAGGYGSLEVSQLTSKVADGTTPFVITSKTKVPNLNAEFFDGATWADPKEIGSADVTKRKRIYAVDIITSGALTLGTSTGVPPIFTQNETPVDHLTVKRVSDVSIENSVIANGSGMKHSRVSTGSIAAGARATVNVVWGTPFASAGYTTLAEMFDSLNPGTAGLIVERKVSQDANGVGFQILNQGSQARTGTLHVIAIRG